MSIEMWPDPNHPGKEYPIGTVGIETNYTAIKSTEVSLDAVREFFPGVEASAGAIILIAPKCFASIEGRLNQLQHPSYL